MARMFSSRRNTQSSLHKCRSGGVLIYIAFALPFLMGVMAMSIDLGRSFILNSELKDFSDAAALAGAAELDGLDGARASAEQAARTGLGGTLTNIQAFATDGGGPNIAVDQVVFLRNLPADGTNFTAADTATSDADARFIFVSVVNRSVRSGLSRVLGVIPDFQTGARSIAGFPSRVICRVPAMFICNPLEDGAFPDLSCNTGPGAGLQDCLIGHQLLLKNDQHVLGGDHAPGNFGLIETPEGEEAAEFIAEFLASAEPGLCIDHTIRSRSGEAAGPTTAGINTRFDLYENPQFGWWTDDWGDRHTDWRYRPALNVTKGYTHDGWRTSSASGGTCVPQGSDGIDPPRPDDAQALPRDTCFATDSCASGRWGENDWHTSADATEYWSINHGGIAPIGWTSWTRYEVYRWEIENGIPNTMDPDNLEGSGENGNPQCYTGALSDPSFDTNGDPEDDQDAAYIDRRIMTVAVANCLTHRIAGSGVTVPIQGYMDLFLTEPARLVDGLVNVFAEVVSVTAGNNVVAHDIVQLYR